MYKTCTTQHSIRLRYTVLLWSLHEDAFPYPQAPLKVIFQTELQHLDELLFHACRPHSRHKTSNFF